MPPSLLFFNSIPIRPFVSVFRGARIYVNTLMNIASDNVAKGSVDDIPKISEIMDIPIINVPPNIPGAPNAIKGINNPRTISLPKPITWCVKSDVIAIIRTAPPELAALFIVAPTDIAKVPN